MSADFEAKRIVKTLKADIERVKALIEMLQSPNFGQRAISKLESVQALAQRIVWDSTLLDSIATDEDYDDLDDEKPPLDEGFYNTKRRGLAVKI